jgi:cysteinyl-tRNA synthetase
MTLIKARDEAKKRKDFEMADSIRDELLKKGIKLIDSREGTIIKRCS